MSTGEPAQAIPARGDRDAAMMGNGKGATMTSHTDTRKLAEARVLEALRAAPTGRLTVAELAERLHHSQTTVRGALTYLHARGAVEHIAGSIWAARAATGADA